MPNFGAKLRSEMEVTEAVTRPMAGLSDGHFLIRRAKFSYLDNQKVSEKIQHMAEKLSLRYVEIRGLF